VTFSNDFTFTVTSVLVPKNPAPPTSSSSTGVDRGVNTGVGRNPGTSATNSPGLQGTQLYGFGTDSGNWTFDDQGRVFGFWAEFGAGPCTSNSVVTNGVTNIVVTCVSLTNSVSFTGTVVPGKHLTLKCSTPNGQLVYRGVPAVQLADISGSWIGIKKGAKIPTFNEQFTLSADTNSVIPNVYDVNGFGPGYQYTSGLVMISSQHQMSFSCVTAANPDNPGLDTVRAVNGSFNINKAKGTLTGWDQPVGPFVNRINFRVIKQ
jgi:hypothetical protein